jgi:type 1 glutamine amidotransferase
LASVTYTEDLNSVLGKLPEVDVLYFTSNQPINDPKLRQGLFDFVNAGKGLVLVHAGLWYNQKDWPDYNAQLAGGGSRSHDNYGLFEVQVVNRNHPLTKNVPERFPIKDELYRHRTDPNGANIQILAIGVRPGSEQSYPLLWITQHPKGRIVCLTLGHDGEAHNHPAYQTLLRNAVQWAAGQN